MPSALTLFAFIFLLTTPTLADEHPNVLFIAVDDLNDWIGCMKGHPQAQTPNIDRLAERGVLFLNAHCAAPACNPSRAAVFSGRMPDSTGVWSNDSPSLDKLDPDCLTVTRLFQKNGYYVVGAGKMLHRNSDKHFQDYFSPEQRWSPFDRRQVDYSEDEQASKGSSNPRHVAVDQQGNKYVLPLNRMPSDRKPNSSGGESFDWGPFDVPDEDFGDTKITNWAIELLQQPSEKPLFLAVGYYRPHIPLWAPKRFFERFKTQPAQLPPIPPDDLNDLSDTGRRWAIEAVTAGSHATVMKHDEWRPAVEAYLACVSYIDHEIGRLLDAFDDSPFANNSLIVLWSDHGWHLGEKQHWGKWTGWERSTRVPLIIVPPTESPGYDFAHGASCEEPVSLIDLYPTLVDLCTLEIPEDEQSEPQEYIGPEGNSLLWELRKPHRANHRHVTTLFDVNNATVRSNQMRYIRYADQTEELYDHRTDPHEWANITHRKELPYEYYRLQESADRHWVLPQLNPLAEKLKPLVLEHYPNATVEMQDNTIKFSANTRTFHVHHQSRFGGWSEKARQVIGPRDPSGTRKNRRPGGIVGKVSLSRGRYSGQHFQASEMAPPHELVEKKPYYSWLLWTQFSSSLGHTIHAELKYARDMSPEFRQQLKTVISKFDEVLTPAHIKMQ